MICKNVEHTTVLRYTEKYKKQLEAVAFKQTNQTSLMGKVDRKYSFHPLITGQVYKKNKKKKTIAHCIKQPACLLSNSK